MSYELYWDGRPELAVSYRKADEIRQQRSNNDAWLQGVYFLRASAAVLNKKAKYPKEPIAIFGNKAEENELNVKQEKAKAAMIAFAERFNKKMHSDADARGDKS